MRTTCRDTRLGVQLQTVATDFNKIFSMHDKLMVGLTGLGSDVQTMCVVLAACVSWPPLAPRFCPRRRAENLRFRTNMYKFKEERDISPKTFMNMVCSMQYAKR